MSYYKEHKTAVNPNYEKDFKTFTILLKWCRGCAEITDSVLLSRSIKIRKHANYI